MLVDELGRGTNAAEGFGVAWAVGQELFNKPGCRTLFATHFHELTALESDPELPPNSVQNLHVTALTHAESLTMLYEVKPGSCDRSFGANISYTAIPLDVPWYHKQ